MIKKPVTPNELSIIASDVINRQVIAGFKPLRLTNLEKFALYYRAGVPMNYGAMDSKNISEVTTVPAGISWDGRKFIIGFSERTAVLAAATGGEA